MSLVSSERAATCRVNSEAIPRGGWAQGGGEGDRRGGEHMQGHDMEERHNQATSNARSTSSSIDSGTRGHIPEQGGADN